jgi:hypothetical protein
MSAAIAPPPDLSENRFKALRDRARRTLEHSVWSRKVENRCLVGIVTVTPLLAIAIPKIFASIEPFIIAGVIGIIGALAISRWKTGVNIGHVIQIVSTWIPLGTAQETLMDNLRSIKIQ